MIWNVVHMSFRECSVSIRTTSGNKDLIKSFVVAHILIIEIILVA